MKHFIMSLGFMMSLGLVFGQGTLQFNRVLLVNAGSGQVTVPAGKVWKIEANGLSGGIYYQNWSSSSTAWSATNPNPCNGATTGSASIPYLDKLRCATSNNVLIINGIKTIVDTQKPMWLPAATTVSISSTPCVNGASMSAGVPYYVRDYSGGGSPVYYMECDGPIQTGTVSNSILVSIIEFNILP
jgi:hypothetical protein